MQRFADLTLGKSPATFFWHQLLMALRHCATFLKILRIRNWSGLTDVQAVLDVAGEKR